MTKWQSADADEDPEQSPCDIHEPSRSLIKFSSTAVGLVRGSEEGDSVFDSYPSPLKRGPERDEVKCSFPSLGSPHVTWSWNDNRGKNNGQEFFKIAASMAKDLNSTKYGAATFMLSGRKIPKPNNT